MLCVSADILFAAASFELAGSFDAAAVAPDVTGVIPARLRVLRPTAGAGAGDGSAAGGSERAAGGSGRPADT